MPEFYRVFPWKQRARPGSPGHPLHVPDQGQAAGRIDNPEHYGVLYLADDPACAIAEIFARVPVWTSSMFVAPEDRGTVRAIARIELDRDLVLDLDEPRALVARALRPSLVVATERSRTRAWALRAFEEERWIGVSWWSNHESQWTVAGIWDRSGVRVQEVERLTLEHPALEAAALTLTRPIQF